MNISDIGNFVKDVGVPVAAFIVFMYVILRQAPIITSAIHDEGNLNRAALKIENDSHRSALKEISAANSEALKALAEDFRATLHEDRGRCDERELRSQQHRHELISKLRGYDETWTRIENLSAEIRQLNSAIKARNE